MSTWAIFIPDYTAYEELLSVFRAFTPIPILLDAEAGYKIPIAALKKEILGRGFERVAGEQPMQKSDRSTGGR